MCGGDVAVQAEAEGDLRRWLGRVIWALSADSPYGTWLEQLSSASGSLLLDAIPVPPTSESCRGSASLTVPWMSEADWECLLRPMIRVRSVLEFCTVLDADPTDFAPDNYPIPFFIGILYCFGCRSK